ncbi:MAG: DUF5711 family protein [Clostridiales bacterium]|jgi:hypothetical protein|nr:DUF5711 family protein [Clostridiales bacterium]
MKLISKISVLFLLILLFVFVYKKNFDITNFFREKNKKIISKFEYREIFTCKNKNFFVIDDNKRISYRNINGNLIWQNKLEFDYNFSSSDSNFLALANNNKIAYFDKRGKIFDKKIINKDNERIVFIKINRYGSLCFVIREDNDYQNDYKVVCIDKNKNLILNYKLREVENKENIYPVSCELSFDEKILIISILVEDDINIKNKILIIDLEDNKNRISKSIDIKDNFIFNTKFLKKDKIIFFGNEDIILNKIESEENIREISRIKLNNTAYRLNLNDKYLLIVFKNNKNIIYCYCLSNLKLIKRINLGSEISRLENSFANFFVEINNFEGSQFIIINKNLKNIFEYKSDKVLEYVMLPKDKNKILEFGYKTACTINKKYINYLN